MCTAISEWSYMLSEDLETVKVPKSLSSDAQGQIIYSIQKDVISISPQKWLNNEAIVQLKSVHQNSLNHSHQWGW